METIEFVVNLDLPANERWQFLTNYKQEINELLKCYLDDFEGSEFIFENIDSYKKEIISEEYLDEIEFISSISKFSPNEVLIANLYYDVLKFYFGCTAFAVENEGEIKHARNLDWWTENNLLSDYSKVFIFQKDGKTIFKTIGWVGFIGALSGVKPGKFSVTLNAVLSKDSPEFATPISFLLRDVFNNADSFEEAKKKLEETTIASDCLLLLSGTKLSEMVVIERTPKRFATRGTQKNFISVTNDYKLLENDEPQEESMLQITSCSRYDRVHELINKSVPKNADECLSILKDDNIMMEITVQQMVFDNQTGEVVLIKTDQGNELG